MSDDVKALRNLAASAIRTPAEVALGRPDMAIVLTRAADALDREERARGANPIKVANNYDGHTPLVLIDRGFAVKGAELAARLRATALAIEST